MFVIHRVIRSGVYDFLGIDGSEWKPDAARYSANGRRYSRDPTTAPSRPSVADTSRSVPGQSRSPSSRNQSPSVERSVAPYAASGRISNGPYLMTPVNDQSNSSDSLTASHARSLSLPRQGSPRHGYGDSFDSRATSGSDDATRSAQHRFPRDVTAARRSSPSLAASLPSGGHDVDGDRRRKVPDTHRSHSLSADGRRYFPSLYPDQDVMDSGDQQLERRLQIVRFFP